MTEAGAIVAAVVYTAVVVRPLVGFPVINHIMAKRAREKWERRFFQNRLIEEAHAIAANAYRLACYYEQNKAAILRQRSGQ